MTNLNEMRKIENYTDLYSVTSNGNIYSHQRRRFLKPINIGGYLRIHLSKKGITKNVYIHRLVAQAFIPNPLNKLYINHKNFIQSDNRVENLEWVTSSENRQYTMRYGRAFIPNNEGEKHGMAILTNKQVKAIKNEYTNSYSKLAKKYDVSYATIWSIINNINWKNVQ